MKALPAGQILRLAVAAAVLLATAPSRAQAATATGTLSVTATVASACLIANGTLAFGTYDPTSGAALNAATTLTLTCSLGTPYNIGMGVGGGLGGTISLRVLTSGTNLLPYKLFRDAGRTLNWGITIGTDTLAATSSILTLANTINVYGQIPASEAAASGSYTDSVTVTVTY
jgi:spore coat protein U-like protein